MRYPGRLSASTDRVLVVLSDIEVAAGGCHDDFLQSEFLVPLLASYTEGEYADKTVELVLNGDTFDFLKVAVDGAYPHHITAEVALAKWALIAKAHAPFLDAIRDFLQGDSRRKVHFIVGNHDLELAFPEVQEAIALRVGWHEQVTFPGMVLRMGDVHIEHGHQMDRMFQVDPDALFVPHGDTSILNLPWGSVALLEVAMPLQPLLYFLDRLKPRKQVFEVLPETKELLISLYWRYWTRDYLRGFRSGADPLKRFTWTMAKEILYRFRSADPDVDNTVAYHQMLRENEDIRLLLTGHDHTPGWWEIHHRKHLQTGCFRNEFLFSQEEGGALHLTPLPCVYAEVWMQGDKVLRSFLVELDPPALPEGYMPASLEDVIPAVQGLLGTPKERLLQQGEQEEQEEQEQEQEEAQSAVSAEVEEYGDVPSDE